MKAMNLIKMTLKSSLKFEKLEYGVLMLQVHKKQKRILLIFIFFVFSNY